MLRLALAWLTARGITGISRRPHPGSCCASSWGMTPASRALDAAVRLLRGGIGCIDVVWVAHLSSTVRLSAGAVVEMIC